MYIVYKDLVWVSEYFPARKVYFPQILMTNFIPHAQWLTIMMSTLRGAHAHDVKPMKYWLFLLF